MTPDTPRPQHSNLPVLCWHSSWRWPRRPRSLTPTPCAGDSIRVFADDAGLGSQPVRTITGPTSGIAECYAIALDTWHNELWVTTQSTVRVFASRVTGDVAPLRTIGGSGLFATAIAVDVEADEVYVGSPGGSIFVGGPDRSGECVQ